MADLDAGWPISRCSSNTSLGLVGVPSMQESAQTADELDLYIGSNADLAADLNEHIDTSCVNASLTQSRSLNDAETASTVSSVNTNFWPSGLSQAYRPNESYSCTYNPTDFSSLAVQENSEYPEPIGCYTSNATPYFDGCYSVFAPPGDVFGTSGLTTIPNNAVADFGDDRYPSYPYAFSTKPWTLPNKVVSLPTAYTENVTVEASSYHDTTMQFAVPSHEESLAIAKPQVFPSEPFPSSNMYGAALTQMERKSSQSDPSDQNKSPPADFIKQSKGRHESQKTDTDSDDEYRNTETNMENPSKRATQKHTRNNSVSSGNTCTEAPSGPVKYILGEKPKRVDAKPWIRTNANTEGDTRTAKINNWKNKYEYKPLPLGTWSSGKNTFKYTQYENVDFLAEAPMSTRKIKEYILKYPCNNIRRLILWIQKMPADQGRRYGSKQHSKCVFKECPIQRYVEGTISTGEYRVAFDEKHYTYGDEVDPYDCAAYAHLYCMEQFLDFEQVCWVADIRIDTRLVMPLEPNGKAAFSMVDVPARYEMERFVKAASRGKLRNTKRWYSYPVHADYGWGQQKPHERTLTYLAHCMYEAHQDDSHKKQAALRRVTVSQRRVHLGDLEMSVADKRIMIEVFGARKKGRKDKVEDHYDEHICHQIQRAKREAEDFLRDNRQAKRNPGRKSKERRISIGDETNDNEPVYDQIMTVYDPEQQTNAPSPQKKRLFRHKKQRVNYAEFPVDTQYQCAQVSYTQAQAARSPEQQLHQLETYSATDFSYGCIPAQNQIPIDPALDTPYGLYGIPAAPSLDIANFPAHQDDIPENDLEKLTA